MSQMTVKKMRKGRGDAVAYIAPTSAFIVVLLGCFLLSGCEGPKTAWSSESRSPDGKLIATASTIQPSGIGTGDTGTRVFLNWTTGSQSPTIILAFSEGPQVPGGMNVGMNWLTPNHLELTYQGARPLDFQAVRWHNVEISVRELSAGTRQASEQ
jgi:hypothetical protein